MNKIISFDTFDLDGIYKNTKRHVMFFDKVIIEKHSWPVNLKIYDFETKNKVSFCIGRQYGIFGVYESDSIFDFSDVYVNSTKNLSVLHSNVFFVHDDWNCNVGHWLYDYYTRFYYLEKLNNSLNIITNKGVLNDGLLKTYNNIIFLENLPDQFILENVYIPLPYYLFSHDMLSDRVIFSIKKLESLFLDVLFKTSTENIYISRQDSVDTKEYKHWHKRQLINEIELINRLENDFGYNAITFSDKTLNWKINLIHKAKNIITQCGASTSYFGFLNKNNNCNCFVIYHPNWHSEENFSKQIIKKLNGSYFPIKVGMEIDNNNTNNIDEKLPMHLPWKITGFNFLTKIIKSTL